MKKIVFKLIAVTLLTLVIFSSCSKDSTDDPVETTVTEDKQNLETTIDGFLTCMQSFENGNFSTSVKNFFNITNGEMMTEFAEDMVDGLDVFNFDVENFNFNANTGTYTWNNNTYTWNFASGNNEMVFLFPSTENSNVNNLELGITSYNSQTVTFDSLNSLAPTAMSAYIKENGTNIFSVELSNVTYEVNNNFSFPSSLDLEIFTAPFTHTFSLSKNNSTEFNFSYDFQNNNDCVTSVSSLIKLNTSDYQNITGGEDFQNAVGTILHQDFEIRYAVEIDNLDAIEDPTVLQINQLVSAEVYYNDAKIGDLEYGEDANSDGFVNIIYKDGTSDNVNIYVGEDFVNQLETIFTVFISN